MSYAKRKAMKIKYEMLAEGALLPGKKSTPFPILKERLDDVFSELIRLTHADDNGMVTCIDGCGRSGHWKDFDCGHFADRDNLPTRWHLDNCRPQAQYCNRKEKGKRYEFGRALNAESPGLADRVLELSEQPGDQIRFKAPEMLIEFRAMLKEQRKRFK